MCSIQMHNKHPSPWHTHSIMACGEAHLSMCLCDTGMILKGHCFAKKILWHQCTVDIAEGFPSLSPSLKPSFLPRKKFQTEEGIGDLTVGFGRCLLPLHVCLPTLWLVPCLCNLPSYPGVQLLPGYQDPSMESPATCLFWVSCFCDWCLT